MRYAVVFSTFAWDAFVARQYGRILSRVREADLFVVVDETAGPVETPVPNRLPIGRADVLRLVGDAPRPRGFVGLDSVMWWNLDILGYRLFEARPDYDYCLTLDYDAILNLDLDGLMAALARDGVDLLAQSIPNPASWSWAAFHAALYPAAEVRAALLAVTAISRGASAHLRARRLAMAAEHAAGRLPVWPFCEAFMPTELAQAGFAQADLSAYGDASLYRWRPILPEAEVAAAMPPGFIHPVRPRDDGTARYRPVL